MDNASSAENSKENNHVGPETSKGAPLSLNFLYDVPLEVGVELGRTDITLKDLLRIQKGTVLELDKLAGEPLEAYLNERLVAKGEVVVVNEKFGIRLTDIVNHPNSKD